MTDEQYRKKMDQHNREVAERERVQTEKKRRDDRDFHQRMRSAGQGTGRPQTTCFAAGTMILTAEGNTPIEDLCCGDKVYAMSGPIGAAVLRPIHKFTAHRRGRIWEIVTQSQDRPISTTAFHRFDTSHGWRWAGLLRSGDLLRTSTGWTQVVSVRRTNRFEPVFNLVVEQDLNFIADGIVAHSFSFFPGIRSWFHRRLLHQSESTTVAHPNLGQS